MPKKESVQTDSISQNRIPDWSEMDKGTKYQLIKEILLLVGNWRPVPPELLVPLPTKLLEALRDAITQLKAEGMAGPHFRASDRIKRLQQLLQSRLGTDQSMKEPTGDQVLAQQPRSFRQNVLSQESRLVREAESQATAGMGRMLATTSNPMAR